MAVKVSCKCVFKLFRKRTGCRNVRSNHSSTFVKHLTKAFRHFFQLGESLILQQALAKKKRLFRQLVFGEINSSNTFRF